MNRIATRTMTLFLLCTLLLGGFGFFLAEYFADSEGWVLSSGSPHIYTGENIACGVVVDRNGKLLLDMNDGRKYSNVPALRQSTVHWIGDRYGSVSAPALPNYASELAGFDVINGVYNYGQNGGIAELTLSAEVQMAALEALGDYKGTVAVYNYKTGQLICSVTTPTYDPDNVPAFTEGDARYKDLYMNRFTRYHYIPGSIFKIVTLAAALENNPDIVNKTFACTGEYVIGNEKVTCEDIHWDQTLKQAFCNSCNCAFAEIALELGAEKMTEYVEKFGITKSVQFDGIATQEGNFQIVDNADLNLAWASIGQHRDLVNPCAFLTFIGAVANDGKVTNPYLVEQIKVDGLRTYSAKTQYGEQIMSTETAKIVQEYMQNNVTVKYDQNQEYFPGLTVGAKTGTGEVEGQKPNAMFAGFVENEKYPLAFIACVEDAGYGKTVCRPIISKVLLAIQQNVK